MNDLAIVSIAANDANASEPNDNGQFTVTMTQASDKDTIITYAVTGNATPDTDYDALSGSVTIAAGQLSATIDVAVIEQGLLEDDETVVVTLTSTSDTDVSINDSERPPP